MTSKGLVFTAFLVGVLAPADGWAQQISYGPIIGRGVIPDKMIVKWGTGSASDGTQVSWRKKGDATFQVATGTASRDHEFTTWPAPGAPMDAVFCGDSRDGMADHKKIADPIVSKAPEVVFESGDIVGLGLYAQYVNEFFPSVAGLVATTPLMAAPGNHDATLGLGGYQPIFPAPRDAGARRGSRITRSPAATRCSSRSTRTRSPTGRRSRS
jgi:hypothetical protein